MDEVRAFKEGRAGLGDSDSNKESDDTEEKIQKQMAQLATHRTRFTNRTARTNDKRPEN